MVSRGVQEFRTKPSDFRDLGGRYRLAAEQGRTYLLCTDATETMVATTAGYDRELYNISCRVFGPIGCCVWQKEYELKRPIEEKDITIRHMKNMYGRVDTRDYTPVKWWYEDSMVDLNLDDYQEYARRIFKKSQRKDVPAWTFVLKEESTGSREPQMVLYVRTAFLETFKSGLDIINYVNLVKARQKTRTVRTHSYRCNYKIIVKI